jgi:hypothetical protein
MNAYAPPSEDFSRRMENLMDSITAEFHHAVAYVDHVVIPEVRRESGGALRHLAVHLERFADKLDPLGARQR